MKKLTFIWLIFFPFAIYCQVDAGEDTEISAGLPLRLSGIFEGVTGTPVQAQDDYFVGPFEIGFGFEYFGSTYTQFAIGPNGLVSFDVPDIIGFSHWDPCSIPNDILPKTIMGPYQDLFSRPATPHTNYIYYATIGSEPERKLVVGWCEAPMFSCEDKASTFQIVLCESGNLIYNHLINKPACENNFGNKATQGLNLDENTGIYISGRNWESWTAMGESWLFTPDGPENYTVTQLPFEPEVVTAQGKINWAWFKGNYPSGELIDSRQSVIINPPETTNYYVEVTLCGGLAYYDDLLVKVFPIPNAFNPESGVEVNRTFNLYSSHRDRLSEYRLMIYNRWGQLVFESEDITEGWDGTYKSQPCESGVYTWVLYGLSEGEKLTQKGSVTLLR